MSTRKVGAFVGSCWATYPKKDTNLGKVIPAAELLVLKMQFLTQVIQKSSYPTYFEWERKG